MNTYFNLILMSLTLMSSIGISLYLLKKKQENQQFLNFNNLSLLIINTISWLVVVYFSEASFFMSFSKLAIITIIAVSIILPFIENKLPQQYKKFLIYIYMAISGTVLMLCFDLGWEKTVVLSIFWGLFPFIFDRYNNTKYNQNINIANNSLIFILLGMSFLNIFYPSNIAITMLAILLTLTIAGFTFIAKNSIIPYTISPAIFHALSFLVGMFFIYYATIGFYIVAMIVPIYFFIENVIYLLVRGYKKLFRKESETYFFFEKALYRGANFRALNKYIMTFLCFFILIAAVYNPHITNFLVGASIFVSFKMIFDFSKWGQKVPTLKETWKQSVSDAKEASGEIKSNLKTIFNKFKK